MKNRTTKLAIAAVCLALTIVLPFITGEIPAIGQMLCPMHIPVFLCGMICGPLYGLVVGLIAPLLRSVLVGMPALYPSALAMSCELATYGVLSGIMIKVLSRKNVYLYVNLLVSMFTGRIVWGIMRYLLASIVKTDFTWELFVAGGFTNTIPGVIIQLILIPAIVMSVRKSFPELINN